MQICDVIADVDGSLLEPLVVDLVLVEVEQSRVVVVVVVLATDCRL